MKKQQLAVKKCFETMVNVLGLHVVELWTQDSDGFGLCDVYVDESSMTKNCVERMAMYHHGSLENKTSRNLCKRAMKAKHGFYWISKNDKRLHPEFRMHTAICFHLPRDNISTDTFVVAYSLNHIKYAHSKLSFFSWLSYGACVAAFSTSLHEISPVKSRTGSVVTRISDDGNSGTSLASSEANQADVAGYRPFIDAHGGYRGQLRDTDDMSSGVLGSSARASFQSRRSELPVQLSTNLPSGIVMDDLVQPADPELATFLDAADMCNRDIDDGTVAIDGEKSLVRAEIHPVNVEELSQSVRSGLSHSRGDFSYSFDKLALKTIIPRNLTLTDLESLEYLTAGSNSHVFSAIWKNQPVIVKILQNEQMLNPVALHEFDIECELLARIDHPNIIKVLGAGKIPRPFIVLERLKDVSGLLDLDGSDTRPSMFRRRSFVYVEILRLARSLADALDYLHSKVHPEAMIIHRDLKPENLGIAADGTLKVFDFGLCRCVKKRNKSTEKYQMTGNTGSIRYMAPEVVLGMAYTEKVDVYSFGILIWTLARNKHPYRGFTMGEHRLKVIQNGERPKLEPGWPLDFRDLLVACWHQNSRSRPNFSIISAELARMIEIIRPTSGPIPLHTQLDDTTFAPRPPRPPANDEIHDELHDQVHDEIDDEINDEINDEIIHELEGQDIGASGHSSDSSCGAVVNTDHDLHVAVRRETDSTVAQRPNNHSSTKTADGLGLSPLSKK